MHNQPVYEGKGRNGKKINRIVTHWAVVKTYDDVTSTRGSDEVADRLRNDSTEVARFCVTQNLYKIMEFSKYQK